jgi:hypothetical protein
MLHQRPPADAKGAGDQRFLSPGLRLGHRLWAPFVRDLRIVCAAGELASCSRDGRIHILKHFSAAA